VVLNAILWVAKAPVPDKGVESTVGPDELALNMDPKGQPDHAPHLTGKWTCRVETGDYSGAPTFDFIHAGQNLLGTYEGRLGEAVVFGSVGKNNSVRFFFNVEREGEEVPITYTGQAESSNSMKGKVKFGELGEGTWTGTK
jgi:hypothetical protein